MSAIGNDTSYRRAEGESTQWEDIQRKKGNFPAVKKPEVRRLIVLHNLGHVCLMLSISVGSSSSSYGSGLISLHDFHVHQSTYCGTLLGGVIKHLYMLQKPKAFQPAPERDKVADLIEAEEASDLDDLEDEFKDDVFLEQYR